MSEPTPKPDRDIEWLREQAHNMESGARKTYSPIEYSARLRSIADRLEALITATDRNPQSQEPEHE